MKSRFLLAALALAALLCGRSAFAAGAIRVTISPNVLLADGISTATVTADVRQSSGKAARDGTEVRFYTTAGNITQVAFTSSGIARATLTASAVPQAANISVSAGLDQTVVTLPMVSKLVEANVGGRVMKIQAKYVAFSEDKRYIQADEQVKIRFRGVILEANSVQIDLNSDTVKALGKVNIASDEQTLVGERVWLDLKTFEGYVVAVGTRKWFSGYGLTELPEKPKNLNPDFELVDFTDSKLIWVGKSANYIFGERVQMQGARAYIAGVKSVRMPFQESNLQVGFGESSQYVGFGTEGLTLDLPLYVRMTPSSSTAFHVGYGAKSGGIGNFTRNRGLSVDLVQKYGFAGASEGQAILTNLSSPDRIGFAWDHTQQINKNTRLVSTMQMAEQKDLYGRLNLTTNMPRLGHLQMAMAAARPHNGTLSQTLSFAFETKPRPVADGKVLVSAETSFYRQDRGESVVRLGPAGKRIRLPLLENQYHAFGLKARPKSLSLGSGFTLDSSVALRSVFGGLNAGFGPAMEASIRKTLPNNGFLSFGVNYNHLATINDIVPTVGKLNATLNLSYPISKRIRLAAIGNMALDANSRHSILSASYQISDHWRFDVLHTMFQFGQFGDFDMQFGISRAIGSRELGLYWSRAEHRFIIEFGAARF
jgi:hypothetical protein